MTSLGVSDGVGYLSVHQHFSGQEGFQGGSQGNCYFCNCVGRLKDEASMERRTGPVTTANPSANLRSMSVGSCHDFHALEI
jgi:hypothetical protein